MNTKMNINACFYKPSGRVTYYAPIMMLLISIIPICIFAIIYSYVNYYMPILFISFIIVAAFGVSIGFIVSKAGILGKVRNSRFIFTSAVVLSLFGMYFSWMVHISIVFNSNLIFISPLDMFETITKMSHETKIEIYSHLGNENPSSVLSGSKLYLLWIGEIATVVVSTLITAMQLFKQNVFCENCNQWASSCTSISPIEYEGNLNEFITDLCNQSTEVIDKLKLNPRLSSYLQLDFISCNNCADSFYISSDFIETINKGMDNQQMNSTKVIKFLKISEVFYTSLLNKWSIKRKISN